MLFAVSVVPSKEPHFYLAGDWLAGFSAIKFTPAGFPSPSLLLWKDLSARLRPRTSARVFGAQRCGATKPVTWCESLCFPWIWFTGMLWDSGKR